METKLLVIGAALSLASCAGDKDLPPVGTKWQECNDNGCVNHWIGVIYDCSAQGSPLIGTQYESTVADLAALCSKPGDAERLVSEFDELVCNYPMTFTRAPACAYVCNETAHRCDFAVFGR